MAAMPRKRVDLLLVERGTFDSRARAQAAIAAGLVSVDGRTVSRASDLVTTDAAIVAEAPHPWVSRGGIKLAHGLDYAGWDVGGAVAIDVAIVLVALA